MTIKVFVHANGKTDIPSSVTKSTNHGDDAAALEIARTSTYKPATKDGKPADAFLYVRAELLGDGRGRGRDQ